MSMRIVSRQCSDIPHLTRYDRCAHDNFLVRIFLAVAPECPTDFISSRARDHDRSSRRLARALSVARRVADALILPWRALRPGFARQRHETGAGFDLIAQDGPYREQRIGIGAGLAVGQGLRENVGVHSPAVDVRK